MQSFTLKRIQQVCIYYAPRSSRMNVELFAFQHFNADLKGTSPQGVWPGFDKYYEIMWFGAILF